MKGRVRHSPVEQKLSAARDAQVLMPRAVSVLAPHLNAINFAQMSGVQAQALSHSVMCKALQQLALQFE